ncbi:MAG: hypothetical protein R2864_14045 [Syntrophotaleaceae bacterium]
MLFLIPTEPAIGSDTWATSLPGNGYPQTAGLQPHLVRKTGHRR